MSCQRESVDGQERTLILKWGSRHREIVHYNYPSPLLPIPQPIGRSRTQGPGAVGVDIVVVAQQANDRNAHFGGS